MRLERNNGRIRQPCGIVFLIPQGQPLNAGFQYHNITRYFVPLGLGISFAIIRRPAASLLAGLGAFLPYLV